jgi:hypothetical protein
MLHTRFSFPKLKLSLTSVATKASLEIRPTGIFSSVSNNAIPSNTMTKRDLSVFLAAARRTMNVINPASAKSTGLTATQFDTALSMASEGILALQPNEIAAAQRVQRYFNGAVAVNVEGNTYNKYVAIAGKVDENPWGLGGTFGLHELTAQDIAASNLPA